METLDMSRETWRFESSAMVHAMTSNALQLSRELSTTLDVVLHYFGKKLFCCHEVQRFPSFAFALPNACSSEEIDFKLTVEAVILAKYTSRRRHHSSHNVYRVKQLDDGSLMLKAQIAPPGNQNSLKFELVSDCAVCSREDSVFLSQ